MIYNSFNFIIIFPLIFLLYYVIPARYGKARNIFLLAASYLLYLQWKPVYALVLLGITAITYCGALMIEKSQRPKRALVTTIVATLLPMGFFKYYNFLNDSISSFLASVGLQFHLPGLNWAIPVGISFFSLTAVGYVYDVYKKKNEAEKDFLNYALFISFFPCILSGPINRGWQFLPQLKNLRPYFDYAKAVEGLKMILWGMFMKVAVADRIFLYVDKVLPDYSHYTGVTCLVAAVLYSIQLYADFAGYSLMAIGVGKTLGLEIAQNFKRPYFAVSVSDFWGRWHISLSFWLRDYVYIPLGGSRCSKLKNYRNLFLTFFVSGIWHGANWTWIIWGCWHGLFVVLEKIFNQQKCRYGNFGRAVKILITFVLVCFTRIFSGVPTLSDSLGILSRIFDSSLPATLFLPTNTDILLGLTGIAMIFIKDFFDEFLPDRLKLFDNKSAFIRRSCYVVVFAMIMLSGVFAADQFIYVKF